MEIKVINEKVLKKGVEFINLYVDYNIKGIRQKMKEKSKEFQALFTRYGKNIDAELKEGMMIAYTYSKNLGTSKYPDCYREVALYTIKEDDKICIKCIKTKYNGIIHFKYIIGIISKF